MLDRRYFKVTGGAVQKAIDEFLILRNQHIDAQQAFLKEVGGQQTYGNERVVAGIFFKDGVPEGWRRERNHGYCVPAGRTPEAKALRARMRNLPCAGAEKFTDIVLGTPSVFRFMEGLAIGWMGFEKIGDTMILSVPKVSSNPWEPPDEFCSELKMSEYWQLKESVT